MTLCKLHVSWAGPGPGTVRSWTEMHLGRAAVIAGDTCAPEQVVQVGVVAVPEERFRVRGENLGIDLRDDSDLVIPADRGEDRPNRLIGEGLCDVGCASLGTGTQ